MSSLSRPLRCLAVRRGLHHRPLRLPISILPPRLVRPIKVQAPGQNSSSDQSGPTDFDNIEPNISASPTASSSQHPFAGHLNSASQSEPSSSKSVVTTLPSPPEKVFSVLPPHLQHPFDTHAFVSYLEKADLEPATARSLMEAVKLLITRRGEKTRDDMVGKEDQENAAYLFRAALSELRTELSVRARNDGIALRAMTGAIRREVEGLEQKLKEDVQTLKHDIEMDMNNRKSETRTEMKGFDIDIEEINNKFTISLGDLRTEIETAKWDSTRRAISIIVILVVCGVAATIYTSPPQTKTPIKTTPTPMRDIAVGSDDDLVEDSDPEAETVETLEKLLSDSGVGQVEIPVRKTTLARTEEVGGRGREREEVNVRRI